ncbi:MAG: hypothetical protein R3A52_30410 [Polyangiales bacterium]
MKQLAAKMSLAASLRKPAMPAWMESLCVLTAPSYRMTGRTWRVRTSTSLTVSLGGSIHHRAVVCMDRAAASMVIVEGA